MNQVHTPQEPVIAFELCNARQVREELRPLTPEMLELPTLGAMLSTWFEDYFEDVQRTIIACEQNPNRELLAKGLFLALPNNKDYCLFIGTQNLKQTTLTANWAGLDAWLVPQQLLVKAPHFSDYQAVWDDSLYSLLVTPLKEREEFRTFTILQRYGGIDIKLFNQLKIPKAELLIGEVLQNIWYESHQSTTWFNWVDLPGGHRRAVLFEPPSLLGVIGFHAQKLVGVLSKTQQEQNEEMSDFAREVELFIRFNREKYPETLSGRSKADTEIREQAFKTKWFYRLEHALSSIQKGTKNPDQLKNFYPLPVSLKPNKALGANNTQVFVQKLISVALPAEEGQGCTVNEIASRDLAVAGATDFPDFQVVPDFRYSGVRYATEHHRENIEKVQDHLSMLENVTGVALNASPCVAPCLDFEETLSWSQENINKGLRARTILELKIVTESRAKTSP